MSKETTVVRRVAAAPPARLRGARTALSRLDRALRGMPLVPEPWALATSAGVFALMWAVGQLWDALSSAGAR